MIYTYRYMLVIANMIIVLINSYICIYIYAHVIHTYNIHGYIIYIYKHIRKYTRMYIDINIHI